MPDKKATGLWLRAIIEVLNREWDPIGVALPGGVEDEYDSYAGKLAAMIRDHATDEQLMDYLEWAEVENMGLGHPFDRERGKRVITALRAVGYVQ